MTQKLPWTDQQHGGEALDLSIVMPCLNESETLASCIQKAMGSLARLALRGEVVIADNGSTDGSIELAQRHGARVVNVPEKGYGSALRGGIEAAHGRWILMGDSDDSYDFSRIEEFVARLAQGDQLVMGCRMPRGGGTVLPGAMPWKHRWIGNPLLSTIGRLFFKCPVNDFHCGLRAFSKEAFQRMQLMTTGMEFASEMVIKATLFGMKISEVPIVLHPDGRSRPPHLRSWRDGWRHLRFMLLYSPRWLFLLPGLVLIGLGTALTLWLLPEPRRVGKVVFDVHTLLFAALMVLLGFQTVAFAFFSKVYAIGAGLLPEDPKFNRLFRYVSLETGLILGSALTLVGLVMAGHAMQEWSRRSFGPLEATRTLRAVIPAVLTLLLGCQIVLSSFFLSMLGLRHKSSRLR